MSVERVEMYWQAITQIEAQDVLIRMRMSDYPHMKNEMRSRMHQEFRKMAFPNDWQKSYTTIEDLIRKVHG